MNENLPAGFVEVFDIVDRSGIVIARIKTMSAAFAILQGDDGIPSIGYTVVSRVRKATAPRAAKPDVA